MQVEKDEVTGGKRKGIGIHSTIDVTASESRTLAAATPNGG
jgi:hypothetical protein